MKHLARAAIALVLSWIPAWAAERPNVVVINIDDLGYADIGPFGSTLNRTPHLDRMAREGRRLTCFYAAPVCSPSRSALMTGCYPKRVLPIPGVLFPAARVGLNPAERTVAEVLKDVGYKTACVGKWHLGDQTEFLPTRQGFDSYFGIPFSNDMGPAADGAKSSVGEPNPESKGTPIPPAATESDTGIRGASQPPLPLVEGESAIERVRAEQQATLTQRFTEKAVEFIRNHEHEPFFLYLAHAAVHFPLYPGADFRGKSSNGAYGDWVEEVDWSVGRVLDTLRELNLSERTLVLFTSDNGGTSRAINSPLRGSKESTWEGGMRVPTIAWWPGRIPAGTATDEICGMIDVLPTLARLASAPLPVGVRIDGCDIWPLLDGRSGATSSHEVFYFFSGLNLEAVRSGPWKLHLAKTELFNLADDIAESTDVAAAHPDKVRELRAAADAMGNDLGLEGVGVGCRALGRSVHPRPLLPAEN